MYSYRSQAEPDPHEFSYSRYDQLEDFSENARHQPTMNINAQAYASQFGQAEEVSVGKQKRGGIFNRLKRPPKLKSRHGIFSKGTDRTQSIISHYETVRSESMKNSAHMNLTHRNHQMEVGMPIRYGGENGGDDFNVMTSSGSGFIKNSVPHPNVRISGPLQQQLPNWTHEQRHWNSMMIPVQHNSAGNMGNNGYDRQPWQGPSTQNVSVPGPTTQNISKPGPTAKNISMSEPTTQNVSIPEPTTINMPTTMNQNVPMDDKMRMEWYQKQLKEMNQKPSPNDGHHNVGLPHNRVRKNEHHESSYETSEEESDEHYSSPSPPKLGRAPIGRQHRRRKTDTPNSFSFTGMKTPDSGSSTIWDDQTYASRMTRDTRGTINTPSTRETDTIAGNTNKPHKTHGRRRSGRSENRDKIRSRGRSWHPDTQSNQNAHQSHNGRDVGRRRRERASDKNNDIEGTGKDEKYVQDDTNPNLQVSAVAKLFHCAPGSSCT